MVLCDICGNEIGMEYLHCPYCDAKRSQKQARSFGLAHKVVNLEKGMPLVAQALARMELELESARKQGYKTITLIHGYGSSGKGGGIKKSVRRTLQHMQEKKELNTIVHGEHFGNRSPQGRNILKRFPFLKSKKEYLQTNPGVTLVVLNT